MQQFQKIFYLGPSIILFTEDKKMWMIHIDMLEIFVILQLKQHQCAVLEQDIELCPFRYFPVNYCWKGHGNFICKFLELHILLFVSFFFC
jgi:hypothetical protein